MRFLAARQIWHDAFTVSYSGSTWTPLDPRRPRWDFFTRTSARAVGKVADTRVGKSNLNQIINAVEQGHAQSIIAKLPEIDRSWGMYAYVDPFSERDLVRLRQWLLREWVAKHSKDYERSIYLNYRRTATLLLAIETSLSGVKHSHITGHGMTPSQVGAQIGCKNPTRDGWMRRVHEMSMLLDKMDQRALAPLATLAREVNEDADEAY